MLTPPCRQIRTEGAPFPIHGRVRTGCFTCRARKIKCSEEKPICAKCARVKRPCLWKTRGVEVLQQATSVHSPARDSESTLAPDAEGFVNSPAVQTLMTSQDIYLCTTIDLMAATEAPQDLAFGYFTDVVQSPLISPFDLGNWQILKMHIEDIGAHDRAVAAAILAVQSLYKAQVNALPTTLAMSVCQSAHNIFNETVKDEMHGIESLLVIAFLLCLAEAVIPSDAGSVFLASEGAFVRRLEASASERALSPFTWRIVAYLRILHAAARRGGGPGLLSPTTSDLLPKLPGSLPSLPAPDDLIDAATALYDNLSAPIFDVYLQLQLLSAQVADLSHYHRSRITSVDQEEVDALLGNLKNQISNTWAQRPSTMRICPDELRVNLSPAVSEPLIPLIGLCTAAFHTEIVEIGRTLSDPPLASPEARQHMRHIRDVVEGNWNARQDGRINVGYLRPLFLYAIESISTDHAQWAVDRIKTINDHICRSDFFAAFAKALVDAQRMKERRVTTKWFCFQTFGVPPPYL